MTNKTLHELQEEHHLSDGSMQMLIDLCVANDIRIININLIEYFPLQDKFVINTESQKLTIPAWVLRSFK